MQHEKYLKMVSMALFAIGAMLLFGPKSWFPSFYNPRYMGIVALISPLLIYLPVHVLSLDTEERRKLTFRICLAVALSLSINIAGELGLYQLYRVGFQYDKFAHFFVSMLFAFLLTKSLKEWKNVESIKIVWLTFLIIFGSGILWELFEATSDFLFKTQEWGVYGQHLALDTYQDIACNTLGALTGIILFLKRLSSFLSDVLTAVKDMKTAFFVPDYSIPRAF